MIIFREPTGNAKEIRCGGGGAENTPRGHRTLRVSLKLLEAIFRKFVEKTPENFLQRPKELVAGDPKSHRNGTKEELRKFI